MSKFEKPLPASLIGDGSKKRDCLHCKFAAAIEAHFADDGVIDHDEVIADVAFLLTQFLAAESDPVAKRVTRNIVKAVPMIRSGGNYPRPGAALEAFRETVN